MFDRKCSIRHFRDVIHSVPLIALSTHISNRSFFYRFSIFFASIITVNELSLNEGFRP